MIRAPFLAKKSTLQGQCSLVLSNFRSASGPRLADPMGRVSEDLPRAALWDVAQGTLSLRCVFESAPRQKKPFD